MAPVEHADPFILLRHAGVEKKLGDRARDFDRRLDWKGRQVSLRLSTAIPCDLRPTPILSGPFRRCVDTVGPLAHALELEVVARKR